MYLQMPDSLLNPTPASAIYYTQDTKPKLEYLADIAEPMITIKTLINKEIARAGYSIENINISSFKDFDGEFKIYNIELKEEIEDYSALLNQEKVIKKRLDLYSKKIILELV